MPLTDEDSSALARAKDTLLSMREPLEGLRAGAFRTVKASRRLAADGRATLTDRAGAMSVAGDMIEMERRCRSAVETIDRAIAALNAATDEASGVAAMELALAAQAEANETAGKV